MASIKIHHQGIEIGAYDLAEWPDGGVLAIGTGQDVEWCLPGIPGLAERHLSVTRPRDSFIL